MRTETERKRKGWFSHTTREVYITNDEKRFFDNIEAENWEWYLNNKKRIMTDCSFTTVSPLSLKLNYIVNPIFSYKFHIDKFSKDKEVEIIDFLYGYFQEQNIDFGKEKIFTTITSRKNKIGGWYVVIFDSYLNDNKLHFLYLTDLVTNKTLDNE